MIETEIKLIYDEKNSSFTNLLKIVYSSADQISGLVILRTEVVLPASLSLACQQ